MIKNIIEKVRMFFNNQQGDNKKKIENLVIFIIILIITIIAINIIWKDDKKDNTSSSEYKQLAINNSNNIDINKESLVQSDKLDDKLENILSKIEGVGKVSVLITYSESSEVVAMYNENSKQSLTEETDSRRTEIERLKR